MQPVEIFLLYLLIINIAALVLFGVDKYKARHQRWRIPEASLLLTALLGGSIGAICGMRLFHHKTKHKKFTIGLPAILLLHILLLAFYLYLR